MAGSMKGRKDFLVEQHPGGTFEDGSGIWCYVLGEPS